jgi:hypothetical protein
MAGSVVLELECGRRESIGGIVPLLTVPRTYEELYIKGCGALPYAITNVADLPDIKCPRCGTSMSHDAPLPMVYRCPQCPYWFRVTPTSGEGLLPAWDFTRNKRGGSWVPIPGPAELKLRIGVMRQWSEYLHRRGQHEVVNEIDAYAAADEYAA